MNCEIFCGNLVLPNLRNLWQKRLHLYVQNCDTLRRNANWFSISDWECVAKEEWNSTVGKKQELRFGCSRGLYECNGARRLLYAVNCWTKPCYDTNTLLVWNAKINACHLFTVLKDSSPIQNKIILYIYAMVNGQVFFCMFLRKFRIDGVMAISFHILYILLFIICHNIPYCNVS